MRKILLTIQYNGKNFCGWQVQPNKRTVQEVLEKRISNLLGEEKISLFASGRTDSGVHAYCQTAHFETDSDFDIKKLANAINSVLDTDISVLSAKEVSKNFHARFSIKQKTYLYRVYCSDVLEPLNNGRVAKVNSKVINNFELIKKASKFFIGTHNFYGFCASRSSTTDFVRTIFDIKIKKTKKCIDFYITGSGFLYNMVRIIVGTLISVGEGKILPEEIPEIIESQDRKKAGKTMPAYALYLYNVKY